MNTAVDRFSALHDAGGLGASLYREILPSTKPESGEQYAFDVDLDACSGCKACVTACHSMNGLDDGETWRGVGLLVGLSAELPSQQHVTFACHHCLDPACRNGCPVGAYEKDDSTGIVRHLDDRCIGCRYCMLTCPYDVPQFNPRLGIVRKCDLCTDRLAEGEAPACAEGCPNDAIRIRVVSAEEIRGRTSFLPGAPDPTITFPTTLYRSERAPASDLPGAIRWAAADSERLRPAENHPPLVAMLVLTQLSVGGFVVGRVLDLLGGVFATTPGWPAAMSLGAGVLAIAASTLHLGRPSQAWRAVLGFRTSWLSREVAAFGAFAVLAVGWTLSARLFPELAGGFAHDLLSCVVAALGLAAVLASAMLYHATRRPFWTIGRSGPLFLLSTAVLGVGATLAFGLAIAARSDASFVGEWGRSLAMALALLVALKLVLEASVLANLRARRGRTEAPLWRTARLLAGELHDTAVLRLALASLGGIVLPVLFVVLGDRTFGVVTLSLVVATAFALVLWGELLERSLFFRAVTAPKMPGGLA